MERSRLARRASADASSSKYPPIEKHAEAYRTPIQSASLKSRDREYFASRTRDSKFIDSIIRARLDAFPCFFGQPRRQRRASMRRKRLLVGRIRAHSSRSISGPASELGFDAYAFIRSFIQSCNPRFIED